MTLSPLPHRRRDRHRSSLGRWLVAIAVLVLVFAVGVAVGQALEDQPRVPDPVTNISTIRPWTQTQP